jgi:PAS domain S-box-containing protein
MDGTPLAAEQLDATDLHVEATYRLTEALVEAESQMRRRVQMLSEVVFEIDADGCFVFLNDAWAKAVGHEPAACLGRQLCDFVLDEDRPTCRRAMADAGAGGSALRPLIRMRRADGAVAWMEVSIDRIPTGGAVGVLHDVTTEKLAQDELKKLSLVASYTDNLVLITDGEGRTEWVNRAFTEHTGYTLADLAGRTPGEVLQGKATDRATVARIGEQLREGSSFDSELLNYTKQGEPYWVQLHITPIHNARGEVERFVSIQTDSTELRRTQHELEVTLVRAEAANEAKTQFLATVSHEMRTPLNAILGSAELALADESDPSALHAHLSRIRAGSEALLRLITDILDVSKIEAGQIDVERVPMEISSCLRGAVAPIAESARAKGLEFFLLCDDSLPPSVVGDPERLRQIVTNLAENAVKFTDSGFVRVEAHRLAPSESGGVALEIRVVDSGVGIPAEAQERVFERFVQGDGSTTRRAGGAGLGLSIVRSLVEALGGSVRVQSLPGAGADFRVTLPLVPVSEPALSAPPPERPARGGPVTAGARAARILVAEDNDLNFAVLEAYLTRAGYSVERALDGREAVAAAPRCDLVVMDVEMPGMDGLEATRRIRSEERERGVEPTPVLALTAHALQEYRDRCLSAGCTSYLSKPVRQHGLLEAVGAALDGA